MSGVNMSKNLDGFFKPEHSMFDPKACTRKPKSKNRMRQIAAAREKREQVELDILREAQRRNL
jgi:hypothetical protein